MKDTCERCAGSLEPSGEAMICSYECTFCVACTEAMDAACPNCGGELVSRPRRTTGAAQITARTPGRVARYLRRRSS